MNDPKLIQTILNFCSENPELEGTKTLLNSLSDHQATRMSPVEAKARSVLLRVFQIKLDFLNSLEFLKGELNHWYFFKWIGENEVIYLRLFPLKGDNPNYTLDYKAFTYLGKPIDGKKMDYAEFFSHFLDGNISEWESYYEGSNIDEYEFVKIFLDVTIHPHFMKLYPEVEDIITNIVKSKYYSNKKISDLSMDSYVPNESLIITYKLESKGTTLIKFDIPELPKMKVAFIPYSPNSTDNTDILNKVWLEILNS